MPSRFKTKAWRWVYFFDYEAGTGHPIFFHRCLYFLSFSAVFFNLHIGSITALTRGSLTTGAWTVFISFPSCDATADHHEYHQLYQKAHGFSDCEKGLE
jgi:hypothetical protein